MLRCISVHDYGRRKVSIELSKSMWHEKQISPIMRPSLSQWLQPDVCVYLWMNKLRFFYYSFFPRYSLQTGCIQIRATTTEYLVCTLCHVLQLIVFLRNIHTYTVNSYNIILYYAYPSHDLLLVVLGEISVGLYFISINM